jgi:hypothetical protein
MTTPCLRHALGLLGTPRSRCHGLVIDPARTDGARAWIEALAEAA